MIINRRGSDTCSYSEYHEICDATVCGKDAQCFIGFTDDHRYCVYDSTNGWYWTMNPPSNFCCGDADCPIDPDKGVQGQCDCPDPGCTIREDEDYRCDYGECSSNDDCLGDYPNLRCCLKDSNGPAEDEGVCVDKGSVRSSVW